MSNHTPGPWTVQKRDHGAGIGSSWRINGPTGEIAENYDDSDANARLIAAAPDLLEVCQQAEHWLSQSDRSIEPVEMLRVLRAAIAKAEGR